MKPHPLPTLVPTGAVPNEPLAPACETLADASKRPDSWVDAQTVADFLSVSRDFVYPNAAMLGARRLGTGPRARLRFQLSTALEALTPCGSGKESPQPEIRMVTRHRRSRAPDRLGSGVPLLPIRVRDAA
jgi:hypothetical protein